MFHVIYFIILYRNKIRFSFVHQSFIFFNFLQFCWINYSSISYFFYFKYRKLFIFFDNLRLCGSFMQTIVPKTLSSQDEGERRYGIKFHFLPYWTIVHWCQFQQNALNQNLDMQNVLKTILITNFFKFKNCFLQTIRIFLKVNILSHGEFLIFTWNGSLSMNVTDWTELYHY